MIRTYLLRRIGFFKTLELLDTDPISTVKFFKDLYKNQSYHNAFYRVKPRMIQKGLLEIKDSKIRLTPRGNRIKLMLEVISEML